MESTNSAAEQDSAAAKRLSGIGFEAREVAARMYASMRRAGIDVQDARAHVQAAIPDVSDRTLQRWVSHIGTKSALFVNEKSSGRPGCVDDEKIRVLVGWILTTTDSGTIVKIKDAAEFLHTSLSTTACERTVRRYLSAI